MARDGNRISIAGRLNRSSCYSDIQFVELYYFHHRPLRFIVALYQNILDIPQWQKRVQTFGNLRRAVVLRRCSFADSYEANSAFTSGKMTGNPDFRRHAVIHHDHQIIALTMKLEVSIVSLRSEKSIPSRPPPLLMITSLPRPSYR